jgi:F5/8 type C domain/Cellulase (glycosyl hydrolase family 5)
MRLLFHLSWVPVLILSLTLSACNLPGSKQNAAPFPSSTPMTVQTSGSINPTPASSPIGQTGQHRIGVRISQGSGEFYDRLTGEKFVPRGMNYIRLAWQTKADGTKVFGHALFDPSEYNHQTISIDLGRMHADGYNVVRVFLSPDTMGTETGGLSPGYMDNVADFLNIASKNQIYVMFTLDWVPGGKYGQILNQDCCSTFALMNANFLPAAGLKANQAFYQDFIHELLNRSAAVESIFSYELRNEMFYDGDQPPLSMKTGLVTTANGKSYDMSKPADKERMLDENLVYWIDSMRTSIQQVDPLALVSVGFFHPQLPNRSRIGDPRIAVTEPAIWQSQADFIDLHAYPGFELNLRQYVENFGVKDMQTKPILMGEFGGEVKRFASIDSATQRFVDWQVESCKYGFDGWIFWTWDLTEQPDFFNALMDKDQIEKALAPATRPDPCSAGTGPSSPTTSNLALNASAKASLSLASQPPADAVDGNPDTQWGAGSSAPQWIEIDLGKPSTITDIRLTVAQYPNGNTIHQIWVRGANDSLRLIHEFEGTTSDNQILEFKPDTPLTGIQFVRIVTTQSPSWVSWKEIEVFGK